MLGGAGAQVLFEPQALPPSACTAALVEADASAGAVQVLRAVMDEGGFTGPVLRVDWALDALSKGHPNDIGLYLVPRMAGPGACGGQQKRTRQPEQTASEPRAKRPAQKAQEASSDPNMPSALRRALQAAAQDSCFHVPSQLRLPWRKETPEGGSCTSLPRGEWISLQGDGAWVPGFAGIQGECVPAASAASTSGKQSGLAAMFSKKPQAQKHVSAAAAEGGDVCPAAKAVLPPVTPLHKYEHWGHVAVLVSPRWQGWPEQAEPPKGYDSGPMLALDVDDTVVRVVKSGRAFPSSADDWGWWHSSVPSVLRCVHEAGIPIVLLTNQSGASGAKAATRAPLLRDRLAGISAALEAAGVPTLTLAATHGADFFRKPRPGMWMLAQELCYAARRPPSPLTPPPMAAFVGDAAGRSKEDKVAAGGYVPPASGKRAAAPKADHSCSDLQLALNVGVPFLTPNALFAGCCTGVHGSPLDAPKLVDRALGFVPHRDLNASTHSTSAAMDQVFHDICASHEGPTLTVLVGPPGSGKSTWARLHGSSMTIVNQDKLGSKRKCIEAATNALQGGGSVVIDATNRSVEVRHDWLTLAQQHGATAIAVVLPGSVARATHLNMFRATCPFELPGLVNIADRRHVPHRVIRSGFSPSAFQAPTKAEGFAHVLAAHSVHLFRGHKDHEACKFANMFMGDS